MIFSGILLIVFGFLIIAMPQLVAYLVAAFIIFIGVNILTIGIMVQRSRPQNSEKSFNFMGYEIIRRKK